MMVGSHLKSMKSSPVTLQPKLELLHGPPVQFGFSQCDPQSFRALPLVVSAGGDPPSPNTANTCLRNAEFALQKGNVTWFLRLCKY